MDSATISSNPWTAGAGPISWTHSATANSGLTNTIGLVFTAYESLPSAAPTWDGTSMTQVGTYSGSGGQFSIYIIVNPTYSIAGKTISFSWSTGTSYHNGISVLVTGANQSTTVDASNNTTSSSVDPFVPTITTVAANCMVFGFGYTGTAATETAGANTTMTAGTGQSIWGARSTSTVAAGSFTMTVNHGAASNSSGMLVSIAPPSTANKSNFLAFM